jgi:hypothetical protein
VSEPVVDPLTALLSEELAPLPPTPPVPPPEPPAPPNCFA